MASPLLLIGLLLLTAFLDGRLGWEWSGVAFVLSIPAAAAGAALAAWIARAERGTARYLAAAAGLLDLALAVAGGWLVFTLLGIAPIA